jgi:GNAT superfamily N-acetyltransferase
MNILPVKKEDATTIIEMLQSISNFYPNPINFNEIWLAFISQDHVFGFSFFIKDEIVGYGVIVYETKIRGGVMAHVEDIVVSPLSRGKGIGKKIIGYLIDNASKRGCYKISLSCKTENILFYEKCGFVSDGTTMTIIL